jgi:hypothetical protein
MKNTHLGTVDSKNYFIHFLFFISLFLFILFFLPCKFEQTDEFGMMILASGIYTGDYEHILIFISPIIGKFLTFLYSNITTQLNWYSIFIVSNYFLSWLAILNLILKAKEYKQQKIYGFYFLFLTFGVYFILNYSFTVAAFHLGITAMLYYFFSKKNKANWVLFIVFFIECFLLRSFVFYYLILLFGVAVVLAYFFYKQKIYFKQLSILFFFFFLIFLSNNYIVSRAPEWSKFMDYNIVRGRIQDNPNLYMNRNEEIKLKMNWSESDYQMLYYWNTDIEKKFNLNELKKIVSSIEHSTYWCLYYLNFILLNSVFYQLTIALIFFCFLNKKFNWYLFLLILFSLSSIVLIAQFYIMKERVFLPVLFLLFTILLFSYQFKKRDILIYIPVVFVLVFMGYQSYQKVLDTKTNLAILNENKKMFESLKSKDLVLWGDLKLNYFTGFYQPYLNLKGRIYISNWLSNSPHNIKILTARKSKSIYDYAIGNSNCLWVVEQDMYGLKSNLLIQSYLENYGLKVTCEKIKVPQNVSWTFFKIKQSNLPI